MGSLDQKKNSSKKEGLLVKNLNKSFLKNEVLSNINLEVHRSEAVGLLGPNGAGKTTCFHILTGLIKPNKGQIFQLKNAFFGIFSNFIMKFMFVVVEKI